MYDLTDNQYRARVKRLRAAAGELIVALDEIGAFVEYPDTEGPFAEIEGAERLVGTLGPFTLGWALGYPTVALLDYEFTYLVTDEEVLAKLRMLWLMVERHEDSTKILRLVRELRS